MPPRRQSASPNSSRKVPRGIGRALQQPEDSGILNRLNERRWGRVWECDELLSLVESFEESVRTADL
jgi:hypothetical protein